MFESEIISVDELMDILQIGKNVAYQLLKSDQIKAFKIGRVWKISRSMLDEFIIKSSNMATRY